MKVATSARTIIKEKYNYTTEMNKVKISTRSSNKFLNIIFSLNY